MGMSVGGAQSNRPANAQKTLSSKKLYVSGRTLYGDAVSKDGSASHIELTGDAGAKGKLSGIRLFRNGKPLLVINAKWKDVGGASYREHSDVTVYSEGRVAMREEKEFSPIAVLPGDASDRSPAILTLSSTQVIYGDEGVDCPFSYDVCVWLQSYTPEAAVNSLWTTMADVGYDISNWWNGIWAGADGDTAAELAETVMFAMEAYGDPGIAGLAITIASIASGGLANALVNDVADEIIAWLFWLFFIGV
jgi:hypothetical protein